MQVSFGKFVPVRVFVDKQEVHDKEKDKVTNVLCQLLRNDQHYKDPMPFLPEQQRRFFASIVKDYKAPTKKYDKDKTPNSNVTPVDIKGKGRFLVTGDDIDLKKQFGREYGHKRNEALDTVGTNYAQLGIDAEFTALNAAKSRAMDEMQAQLRDALRLNTLDKTLYVQAKSVPNQKNIKDSYVITLLDFKA